MFYSMYWKYSHFTANEKNVVFRKLESIYRIREESSTSSAPMAG